MNSLPEKEIFRLADEANLYSVPENLGKWNSQILAFARLLLATPAPTAPSDAQDGRMVAKGVEGCANHVWASTQIVGVGPGYICTNCGATWQPHVCR